MFNMGSCRRVGTRVVSVYTRCSLVWMGASHALEPRLKIYPVGEGTQYSSSNLTCNTYMCGTCDA